MTSTFPFAVPPLQSYQYHHDLLEEAFLEDIGFGLETQTETETPPSSEDPSLDNPVVTSPEDGTSSGSGGIVASASSAGDDMNRRAGDDDRRLRCKISNRESARRSRARKQRHLDEQRAAAAVLRASNRDLSERLRGARARNTLVEHANARLRAEGQALGRRLAAARRALELMQLYASYASTPAASAYRS